MDLTTQWDSLFQAFVKACCNKNATFELHYDMLCKSANVIGIYLAERIGGPDSYHLIQAYTKTSLRFAFTIGASAYAAYSTQLVHDHDAAPPFIQNLKIDYFSIPYEGNAVNLGLDTVREEEHRKAKKFFRPGANVSAVLSCMKLIDETDEVQNTRMQTLTRFYVHGCGFSWEIG